MCKGKDRDVSQSCSSFTLFVFGFSEREAVGWAGGGRIPGRPGIAGLAGFQPTFFLTRCVTRGKSVCPSPRGGETRLTTGKGRADVRARVPTRGTRGERFREMAHVRVKQCSVGKYSPKFMLTRDLRTRLYLGIGSLQR